MENSAMTDTATNTAAAKRRSISAAEFLSPRKVQTRVLDLAPFGYEDGTLITIKKLTSLELGILNNSLQKQIDGRSVIDLTTQEQKTCVMACITEDGSRMFTEANITALGALEADVVSYISEEALKFAKPQKRESDARENFSLSGPTSTSSTGSR